MYSLIVENKYGEKLELTHNYNYDVTNVDGLNPPEATINTSKNAGSDGSVFNSAYTNSRQIVITMAVNAPTEANRIALYKYFKPKQPVKLYYKNKTRDLWISGYCQSMGIEYFEKKEVVQITVQCPQPYFNGSSVKVQELSSIVPMLEFPFSINESKQEIPQPWTSALSSGSVTIKGVTFTDNKDGTFTANGTSTSNGSLSLIGTAGSFHLPEGGHILSGGVSSSKYFGADLYDPNSGTYEQLARNTSSQTVFYVTSEEASLLVVFDFYFGNGVTFDNETFYPMIRDQLKYASSPDFESWHTTDIPFSELENDPIVSIVNNGDVETGALITISVTDDVWNPVIINTETGQKIGFDIHLENGDEIIINTRQGEKAADLISNGSKISIVGNLIEGSEFFQLKPTDNLLTVQALYGLDSMMVTFEVIDQYEGA